MRALLVVMVLLFHAGAVLAQDLVAPEGTRWLVIASRQDPDEAIGIARNYIWRFDEVRVVRADNGWLAVIGGPVPLPDGAQAALADIRQYGDIPDDIFFANGERFTETVWTAPDELAALELEDPTPVSRTLDGTSVTLSVAPAEDEDMVFPEIEAVASDGVAITAGLTDAVVGSDSTNAALRTGWLDRNALGPQLVFSSYWMGAHCCTVTAILSQTPKGWLRIDGEPLDGDLGYALEYLDGDGTLELLSGDNSFLYTFGAYAFSFAPLVIERLDGDRLVDLRDDPAFTRFYRQELFGLEHRAEMTPEIWTANTFLAAWVATKTVVGEGDDAWATMLANYNRTDDWPLWICEAELVDGLCPEKAQRDVDFPEALAAHLAENGYPVPEAAR